MGIWLVLCGLAAAQADNPWNADVGSGSATPSSAAMGASAPPVPALQGWRVGAVSRGDAISLSEAAVVGSDGGVSVTTIAARFHLVNDISARVHIPVAAYRSLDGGETNLGNVQFTALMNAFDGDVDNAFGVEAHFNPTGDAFTWANRADELWPGGGVNALWLRQQEFSGLTLLTRGSAGIHVAQGFDPYPGTFFQLNVAAAIDKEIIDRLGFVGEASVSYWDVSPVTVTGLVRGDLIDGLRGRAGMVFPIFNWAGATPYDAASGIREMTFLFDLTMVANSK